MGTSASSKALVTRSAQLITAVLGPSPMMLDDVPPSIRIKPCSHSESHGRFLKITLSWTQAKAKSSANWSLKVPKPRFHDPKQGSCVENSSSLPEVSLDRERRTSDTTLDWP